MSLEKKTCEIFNLCNNNMYKGAIHCKGSSLVRLEIGHRGSHPLLFLLGFIWTISTPICYKNSFPAFCYMICSMYVHGVICIRSYIPKKLLDVYGLCSTCYSTEFSIHCCSWMGLGFGLKCGAYCGLQPWKQLLDRTGNYWELWV